MHPRYDVLYTLFFDLSKNAFVHIADWSKLGIAVSMLPFAIMANPFSLF